MSEEKKQQQQQAFLTEQSGLEDLPEKKTSVSDNSTSESRQSDGSTEGEYYEDDRNEDEDDEEDEDEDEYENPFVEDYKSSKKTITPDPESSSNDIYEENAELYMHSQLIKPLSATPPKAGLQDDTIVEVSSTPAFACLEELFQKGKLTGTQVAQLKAKYIELHLTLKKSRENESKLLRESKSCIQQLELNREILQRADAFPDNLTSEVLKLRAQYLKYENDASCSEERLYNLEYKQSGLEDDKNILKREYTRMPKPQELERRIEQLRAQNNEISKELTQRQEEIKDLNQTIMDKNNLIEIRKRELKEALEVVENYKNDYVQVNTLPMQISKECDRLLYETDEINKEIARIDEENQKLLDQLKEIESFKNTNEFRKDELLDQIATEKSSNFEKEKEFNDLSKQMELEKEKEVVLLSDKATLEISLKHALADKKMEYDAFVKAQKEKERDTKALKKVELQFKAAIDSLANIKLQHEKVIQQTEAQPANDGSLFEKRKMLTLEVEQIKRSLTSQQSKTLIEKVKVEKCIELEEHLLCEQSDCRVQAVEVTRLAAIKADEKEQKAREFMKAETRYRRAVEDLNVKESVIEEHAKRHRELKIKLADFAKMYDVIKNERNKCVNQIQVCTQRAAEMREKIKILSNEVEILRTSSVQKERRLQKQRLKHANAISLRDSIRNEVGKQREREQEMRDLMEQQRMDIGNYNAVVNVSELELTRLRKRYDEAVGERNGRGIELITRGDEVCVVLERANCMESIIARGNLELASREEEVRFLRLSKEEESRVFQLYKKQLPNEAALRKELEVSREQLVKCQNFLAELEAKVENCEDPGRIRYLEGVEETTESVMKKLEEIEEKLAKVEEKCLEKDLILEQVLRLTERIQSKVDASKDDTLTLAKKINAMQGSIKDTTKKMMATVSELSISQASALNMQEEVKNKELLLEQCYTRIEKGEAPTDEIEREWYKMLENEARMRDKKITPMPDDKTVFTLADGYVTTAEPRPNAYIPQTINELPLPKPYGRLAPFKPQEPGSSMRHIKKPNPKPIEI